MEAEMIEIEEAQKRLMEKRRELVLVRPPAPVAETPQSIIPDCQTEAPTGSEERERCRLHPGDGFADFCPVCEEHRAYLRNQRQAQTTVTFRQIQIGKRYESVSFDDFIPPNAQAQAIKQKCLRFAETFGDRLKCGDNLMLLGKPGTGKNMLAACVCRVIAEAGYTALHTTAMKLIRRIRETWSRDSKETEQEVIASLASPHLLVIDEVGVQYGTEKEQIPLFEVINERYEAMRPTAIISNLSLPDLDRYLGPRIIDRFYDGNSAVLEFTWDSYRRRK